MMGDLSDHLSSSEVSCQCCGKGTPHPILLQNYELWRVDMGAEAYHYFNQHDHRGGSCPKHNKDIGGDTDSWHMNRYDPGLRWQDVFYALDFDHALMSGNLDPLNTARLIEKLRIDVGGLGIYYRVKLEGDLVVLIPRFVHYDIGDPFGSKSGIRRKWIHFDLRALFKRLDLTKSKNQFYKWLNTRSFCDIQHGEVARMAKDLIEGRL